MAITYKNGFEFEDYNGWSNYDTWLLHLNITNNYELYKKFEKNILMNVSLNTFVELCLLRRTYYEDKHINFSNVNFAEIYEALGGLDN